MENNGDFPITSEIVNKAEELRKSGNNKGAAELTAPVLGLKDPNNLNKNEQRLALSASRIYGTAKVSLANESKQALEVAEELGLAKAVFNLMNENQNLQKAAEELKTNFEGSPDDYNAELNRLQAKYLITLSCLTGDSSFLNIAADILNTVAEESEEPTAKTLASYEAARISYKADKSRKQYDSLSEKYREAFNYAYKANNWERSATESAWYVVDSARGFHFVGVVAGTINYIKSAIHDKSTWGIIIRQVGKAITEDIRHKGWVKSTPVDAKYKEELRLDR